MRREGALLQLLQSSAEAEPLSGARSGSSGPSAAGSHRQRRRRGGATLDGQRVYGRASIHALSQRCSQSCAFACCTLSLGLRLTPSLASLLAE